MPNLPDVVYIAGYGRSGSTILDIILGQEPGVMSCGELAQLFSEGQYSNIRKCGCGSEYDRCAVWSPILREISIPLDTIDIWRKQIESAHYLMGSKIAEHPHLKEYLSVFHNILHSIKGLGYKTIIDSSKTSRETVRRAIVYQKYLGVNVKVIHLARRLESVLASIKKGTNRQLQGHDNAPRTSVARAIIGRFLANYGARELQRILGKHNYIYIEYEELIRDPVGILELLSHFLEIDYSSTANLIKNGTMLKVGHIVAGNRLKGNRQIKIMSSN